MKYYVMADIHGFYTEMIEALTKAGYFEDKEEHKIIICGDLFDRGKEAVKLQEFILDKMKNDEIILIKGNHEDLTESLVNNWHLKSYIASYHHSNGTVDTLMQLTGITNTDDIYYYPELAYKKIVDTPYLKTIIPSMLDYYETKNYIFVHGWIPCKYYDIDYFTKQYTPHHNWRKATVEEWDKARWINGMEAHHYGIVEKDKTIVSGHWHCNFGHYKYDGTCTELSLKQDYSPYYSDGIISIDACTVKSKIVNCIVIED